MMEHSPFRPCTPGSRLVRRPPKGMAVHAVAGDRLHFPGKTVGVPDHTAIIIETRGEAGTPRTSSAATMGTRRSSSPAQTSGWNTLVKATPLTAKPMWSRMRFGGGGPPRVPMIDHLETTISPCMTLAEEQFYAAVLLMMSGWSHCGWVRRQGPPGWSSAGVRKWAPHETVGLTDDTRSGALQHAVRRRAARLRRYTSAQRRRTLGGCACHEGVILRRW